MIVTVTNTETMSEKRNWSKTYYVYFVYKVGSISILAIVCYYIKIILSGWGAGLFTSTIILVRVLYNNGYNSWSIILLNKIRCMFPSSTHSGNEGIWYSLIFFIVLSENLMGLYMYNQHMLLTSIILALLKLVFVLWLFSYRMYFTRGSFAAKVRQNSGVSSVEPLSEMHGMPVSHLHYLAMYQHLTRYLDCRMLLCCIKKPCWVSRRSFVAILEERVINSPRLR